MDRADELRQELLAIVQGEARIIEGKADSDLISNLSDRQIMQLCRDLDALPSRPVRFQPGQVLAP